MEKNMSTEAKKACELSQRILDQINDYMGKYVGMNGKDVVTDWRTRDDIRHWVVVGSYSTTANAERAIADIMKRMPQMQCNYFKLGSMYAVAAFGSADSEECQEFKRAYVKEFEQSWVYTPKKFR